LFIVPWNTIWLLTNPVAEYMSFSKEVSFPSHGRTVSYIINATISLLARGAISADNPITAKVSLYGYIGDLPSVTNTTAILVEFWGSLEFWGPLAFPLQEKYRTIGAILIVDVSHFPWEGSTSIVYRSSGEFDVSVLFLDSHSQILQRIELNNMITIASEQETFAYVTSVTFVSLDLVIVALMLLDLKDTRTDDRRHRQQRYAETEP
jgi:hypothetical protein